MRRNWTIAMLVSLACGAESPSQPPVVPAQPGELEYTIPPPGYEGPIAYSIRIGLSGQLTQGGFGKGHLPPQAGDMDRVPWLWIGCFVRENDEASYEQVDPVEGSVLPCGFVWHETHLDAVIESQRAPLWQALIVVNVP